MAATYTKYALIGIAESNGWTCTEINGGSVVFDNTSAAGESYSFSLLGDDLVSEMREFADVFDPEEHAMKFSEMIGIPVYKRRAYRMIVEDAYEICSMLEELAEEFENYEQ